VKDQFGNHWSIATHKQDVSPQELQKRAEAAMNQQRHYSGLQFYASCVGAILVIAQRQGEDKLRPYGEKVARE